MPSENANKIYSAVLVTVPEDRTATEAEVLTLCTGLRIMFPIDDEEFAYLISRLHAKLQISMDMGAQLVPKSHEPWLPARKPDIVPFYWDRYETYLIKSQGWSRRVTSTLNRVTDDILDLMGNPAEMFPWQRRGLVMGDVQSGKTATYTALCCKAADAGYRLIILLTGTLESLRKQTQERLDAGFVGLDSSGLLTQQRENRAVGVGIIDPEHMAGVFTSKRTDFRSELINQLGFKLNSFNQPILVVVKKNKRILENLENWLRSYNADATGQIDVPMLMVDDEADNASVNTTKSGQDPTAINKQIRALLKLFKRTTYVGFTATPFANIFIDPETEDEMLGDDLFPSDFIYSLEAPTNYVGAETIFGENALGNVYLHEIEDAEGIIPFKHRSSLTVAEIPESLTDAMDAFIIANVIRDLRGEGSSHRSMLINVSRFTNVQEQVANLVEERLRIIHQNIRNYSQLAESEALQNHTLAELKRAFTKGYADVGFTWNEVRASLVKSALPIVVKSINQRTGASSLDYAGNKTNGLRVIAVGGNSLSRGLTLEGLCTSYFYRNSQMYDTLMQMGRWFGYRDGYADLCGIWMSPSAIQWYSHISLAATELRKEIRHMQANGLAPKDFGLKVRAHPDSLIVTARNKMRSARTIERLISINAEGLETPHLFSGKDQIAANARVTERLLENLETKGIHCENSRYNNKIWREVPKRFVISLLRDFTIHPLNLHFQGEGIAEFLERTSVASLDDWDVVLPSTSGLEEAKSIAGVSFRPQKRKVVIKPEQKSILVSGSKARVGSRGIEREGLKKEVVDRIEAEYKKAEISVPDRAYREVRERPLLLLHIINAETEENGKRESFGTGGEPLVALGLSFPRFSGGESQKVKYRVNTVEWKNMFEYEIDEEVDPDEESI